MPVVIALILAFILYCVLDVILTDASNMRNLPKPAWLVVVVFLPVIGSIAWLLGGRPENTGRSPGDRGSGGGTDRGSSGRGSSPRGTPPRGSGWGQPTSPPRTPPRGPDDDPEFLRRVEERLRRGDQGGSSDEK